MTAAPPPTTIRPAGDDDLDEIVAVCGRALKWQNPDFDRALFHWKHIDNAFGRSLLLVALDETERAGNQIKAVRPFMRWQFTRTGADTVDAARAVDTATLPDAQGKGLFRQLTLAGLERLQDEDCGFIFNTPNAKSLPGYLKMGWTEAGPVQLGFGVSSVKVMRKLSRSRIASDKPSIPTPDLGVSIDQALESFDPARIERSTSSGSGQLTTRHTVNTLRWRYGAGPVTYRFLPSPAGGVIVRLRQRGDIRELVVAQVVGDVSPRDVARHTRNAMDAVDADLCVTSPGLAKTLPLTRLGPTLALRNVSDSVSNADFAWSPGDIELF